MARPDHAPTPPPIADGRKGTVGRPAAAAAAPAPAAIDGRRQADLTRATAAARGGDLAAEPAPTRPPGAERRPS